MASHFLFEARGLFSSGARSQPLDATIPAIAFARRSPKYRDVAREITYLDSTILIVLLRLQRQCARRNGRLVLAEPSRPIERVLNLTGVNRVIGPQPSLERAVPAARSRSVA